jgi:exosortase C (VPDSG-CTERM-specific)
MNVTDPAAVDREAIQPPVARMGWAGYWRSLAAAQRRTLARFLIGLSLLTVAFLKPLAALFIYAAGTDLHSHILLIPFISAYLLHLRLNKLPTEYRASPGWALLPFLAGSAALFAAWKWRGGATELSLNDHLALLSFAYVCLVVALVFLLLGRQWMAASVFPVVFLIFIVPLPDPWVAWMETASQHGSAETADWFFYLAGVPVLRDGNVFELPGIVIRVATECSGIRSSWVLFITSLVAADLFLRTTWRRVIFVALIIPLGLLRNGFRIMVIGWLCTEVGPRMIDSPIHHRGGPLFFGLSLVPLFLLVWWLRRGEARKGA